MAKVVAHLRNITATENKYGSITRRSVDGGAKHMIARPHPCQRDPQQDVRPNYQLNSQPTG
ncbi:MAG: hypothetical protein ACRC6D_02940 [Aeromonas sp.]